MTWTGRASHSRSAPDRWRREVALAAAEWAEKDEVGAFLEPAVAGAEVLQAESAFERQFRELRQGSRLTALLSETNETIRV